MRLLANAISIVSIRLLVDRRPFFFGAQHALSDRDNRWWCTAFSIANVPPLPRDGIETRDLREKAQTVNEQGVTIVPLDVRLLDDGEIHLRARDPAYATPGADEVQTF